MIAEHELPLVNLPERAALRRRRRIDSLRPKLIALTLTLIMLPVLLVLTLVGAREIKEIRTDMLADSALIASVIADSGAAALAFQDQDAAEQTLQALQSHSVFRDAALYDKRGHLFAFFARGLDRPLAPPGAVGTAAANTSIDRDRITVVRPLEHGGERFGTLVLHTNAAPLAARVHAYLWGMLLLFIGVVTGSMLLAVALERMILRRLASLADLTHQIEQTEDYNVRANDSGADEIGLLAVAFNHMLAVIGHRQEQARQAIRVRDEFLSIASHELKTPLTSLKLQVQSLLELPPTTVDPEEGQRINASFSLVERQVRRLERLINNLLDVSRIAVGRFSLQCETVDLVAMLRDVTAQLGAEVQRSGSALTLDLPETAVGCWDATRLEQVVVNLITNAVKYGEGKPIDVRVSVADGRARLEVRDRGLGIDPADQARIFERFERAVSFNYGGLGLGLYICKQIVTAHGGVIGVSSTPGEGATFIVELPCTRTPDAAASAT